MKCDARRCVMSCCIITLVVAGGLLRPAQIFAYADPPEKSDKEASGDAKTEAASREIRIAITGLENKGPSVELAKLGLAISEMTSGELSRIQGLRVVERTGAVPLIGERGLADGGVVERRGDGAERTEQAAEYLVSGTFIANADSTTVKARLIKVQNKEQVGVWDLAARTEDLAALSQELTTNIVKALGLDPAAKRAAPKAETKEPPLVAVLGWKNLGATTRLDPMQAGFSELLQANLSNVKKVKLVERAQLNQVLQEQKLALAGLSDPETAIRVGKLLGAQSLLYGSFLESNGKLRVICRLVDAKTTAVLASENVVGANEEFGPLLDDLTLKLVADFAIEPPLGAEAALKAARQVRQLEAAIHFVTAKDALLRGNLPQASASYAQAVLVEPENVPLHAGLVDTLLKQREYVETIEAANRALALKVRRRLQPLRISMMTALLDSLQNLGRFKELEEASRRALKEFPEKRRFFTERLAESLLGQKRLDDAVLVLFGDENGKPPKLPPDEFNQRVRLQYDFYRTVESDWHGFDEMVKECARRRVIVAEKAFEYFDGKRDDEAKAWGYDLMQRGDVPNWLAPYEQIRKVLPVEQRKELIRRGFEVFRWLPEVAEIEESKKNPRGRRKQAPTFDPNLKTVDQNFDLLKEAKLQNVVPPNSDRLTEVLDSWIDEKTIEDFEQARVLAQAEKDASEDQKKEKREHARRILEAQVRIFGIATMSGAEIVKLSDNLKIDRKIPDQSILIWGGDTEAFVSYAKLFGPSGYTVHPFRLKHITPEHLAPYRLVVLARTGNSPYTPSDLLALRSYVATGGSLLVIVSPGWRPATVGIHNSLLKFFDAAVDDSLTIRAKSTRIVQHPITAGIQQAMAKTAAGLIVPESAALIQADDKTVLAAMSYGKGRVVISSFGQWFLPETAVINVKFAIENATKVQKARGYTETPIEVSSALEQPLLRNVVTWLTEPQRRDEVDLAQIANFHAAYEAALRTFSQAAPWESMRPALEKLVDEAPPGFWKEEALWAAAECAQQMVYRYGGPWRPGTYGYEPPVILSAEPAWYRDLVQQFPDSPLRPYAEFRLGECERREQLNADMRQRTGRTAIYREGNPDAALAVFDKVRAEVASYPWAWSHIRCGNLNMVKSDWEHAAEHFRMVSETMPACPEKMIALASLAHCRRLMGKYDDAKQTCEAILALPTVLFYAEDYYLDWAPRSHIVYRDVGPTDNIAHEMLASIARSSGN